ncbi:MAG TPA: AAA family ATPase, partial [Polyangium sp.]|nr:AAA family ATPase [Polyangium sp.]
MSKATMKLRRFQVQGYKNFTSPVRLDDLGPFNVIHGDNNVGKSNLLESIGLFFVAMQALREETKGGPSLGERYERRVKTIDPAKLPEVQGGRLRWTLRSSSYWDERGFSAPEMFNFEQPGPIDFDVTLDDDADTSIAVRLRVQRWEEDVLVMLLGSSTLPAESTDAQIDGLLDRFGPRVQGKETSPRFALVRSDRTVVGGESEPLMTRKPLPSALALDLHAAHTANDTRRESYLRFADLLECLRDLVGPGTWRMLFDRNADRAELALEKGPRLPLVPLRLMGSGIQQIALLCARIVMAPADIMAIEEPELNLRWNAQRTVHDLLMRIGREPGGPQLFFNTHSGQFGGAATSYILTRTESGPRIQKASVQGALEYTQPQVPNPVMGQRAPWGYVTVEGLVQIPPEVQQELGLAHGGGVVFIQDKDGHNLMLTD